MKLIKQSFEILEQDCSGTPKGIITSPETINDAFRVDIYKHIERCGRICYKSEDKITEESCTAFVRNLMCSKHYAMLEHGTVYLDLPNHARDFSAVEDYGCNPYSRLNIVQCIGGEVHNYVTTNLRVLVENDWLEDLEYLCEPCEHHEKRVTVKFITNRQVTHELVRHRTMSFAQESTRYCNYCKGKFGEELTFIQPCWEIPNYLVGYLSDVETSYKYLIGLGWKPQQAATILPNALKAEIIVTGFMSDWQKVFDLRSHGRTGAPHPQMKEAMDPVLAEFKKRGYPVC